MTTKQISQPPTGHDMPHYHAPGIVHTHYSGTPKEITHAHAETEGDRIRRMRQR